MPDVQIPRRSSSIKGTTVPPAPQQPDAQGQQGTPLRHPAPQPGLSEESASSTSPLLNLPQLHALFDILTHYETYAEVESFKHPETIANYGRPFALSSSSPASETQYASDSSAPLLASLLKSVVLTIPGVRDLSSDFWSVRFQGILVKLAEVGLSDSYDKGAVGTRKTLATVASVIHESITRGTLGGFPRGSKRDLNRSYDTSNAEDLSEAWADAVHELVYGNLIDELYDCSVQENNLEQHSLAVKAASDYVIIQ